MFKRLPVLIALALGLIAPAWSQTETNLNNFGAAPVFSLTAPSNGQCLTYQSSTKTWINAACSGGGGGSGTVTSVGLSIPSLFTITNSPVTTTGTLTATPAGTSGGIPYFNSATSLASTAALTANALVLGGGAGGTPTVVGSTGSTTTMLHGAAGAPTFGPAVLTTDVSGLLPIANGGTATASPGEIAGAGIGLTGSWPTKTIALSTTLTAGSTLVGPELIYAVQSGALVSTTPAAINTYVQSQATPIPGLPAASAIGATDLVPAYIQAASTTEKVTGALISSYVLGNVTASTIQGLAPVWSLPSQWTLATQAANTSADGIILSDLTPATAANQQFSPRIRLTGQGWKTAATAASQTVDWIIENQPVQNTINPTGSLVFSYQNNALGYNVALTLSGNGNAVTAAGAFLAASLSPTLATVPAVGIYRPATNTLGFSTNTTLRMQINAAGHIAYSGTVPVVSACGTTPTIDANATDNSGTVTVGTVAAASCTVTFATAYITWNHCLVTSQTTLAGFGYTYTKTAITVTGTSLVGDLFDYRCDGS